MVSFYLLNCSICFIVILVIFLKHQQLKHNTMKYKLVKNVMTSGKFHYQVIDETGKVISERRSNNDYVACTIDGAFYFGRLDLIGKGAHGKDIKFKQGYRTMLVRGKYWFAFDANKPQTEPTPIAYLTN